MDKFFGLPVLELIQAGFLGFAVLLMFLAYRLLAQLIQRRENENPTNLKVRVIGVFGFLLLTAIVMVLGIYSTVRSSNVTIAIDLTPRKLEMLDTIVIKVGGKSYQRNDGMPGGTITKRAQIPNGQRLTIDLEDVSEFIDSLKTTRDTLNVEIANLKREKSGLVGQNDTLKQANVASIVGGDTSLAEKEGGI